MVFGPSRNRVPRAEAQSTPNSSVITKLVRVTGRRAYFFEGNGMGDAFGECVPPRHIVAPTKVVLLAQYALVDPVEGCPDLPVRITTLIA